MRVTRESSFKFGSAMSHGRPSRQLLSCCCLALRHAVHNSAVNWLLWQRNSDSNWFNNYAHLSSVISVSRISVHNAWLTATLPSTRDAPFREILSTINVLPSVLWRCWSDVRKSVRPVKNRVMRCWRGYMSGARCKWFAYDPADATATASSLASLKSRLVSWFLVPSYSGCPWKEAV